MSNKKDSAPKFHYYMASGNVVYQLDGKEEEAPGCIPTNGLMIQQEGVLNYRSIALAQRQLQVALINKLGTDKFKVLDCVIINIIPMGYMTEAKFNEGRPQEAAVADEPKAPLAPETIAGDAANT